MDTNMIRTKLLKFLKKIIASLGERNEVAGE